MYHLYGIAEALTGLSVVRAKSLRELFSKYPELGGIKDKLDIRGNKVFGFVACDG
jgi:hypothetical protein